MLSAHPTLVDEAISPRKELEPRTRLDLAEEGGVENRDVAVGEARLAATHAPFDEGHVPAGMPRGIADEDEVRHRVARRLRDRAHARAQRGVIEARIHVA